ncbi:MAG: HEAT repeat domain-containing protein, partial [Desulfobacterales bacterium]|nr:HEAT repeat domain-containing protein [Desulfobacterales bacterium]
IQALTERLRKDKNKDVRKKAIDGLVRLEAKEPDVIQALTERLREDNKDVRLKSITGLIKLSPKLIEFLTDQLKQDNIRNLLIGELIYLTIISPDVISELFQWKDDKKKYNGLNLLEDKLIQLDIKMSDIIDSYLEQVSHTSDDMVLTSSLDALVRIGAEGSEFVNAFLQRRSVLYLLSYRIQQSMARLVEIGKMQPELTELILEKVQKHNCNNALEENKLLVLVEVLVQIGTKLPEMVKIIIHRIKKGEIRDIWLFRLIDMGQRHLDMTEMLFNKLTQGESDYNYSIGVKFYTDSTLTTLAEIMDRNNFQTIKEGLANLNDNLMSDAFDVFGQLFLDLDFLADEPDQEYEKQKRTDKKENQKEFRLIRKVAQPDLQRVHELTSLKHPPSGTDGLKTCLDFLIEQYPVIPKHEKKMVRTLAADWFVVKSKEVENAATELSKITEKAEKESENKKTVQVSDNDVEETTVMTTEIAKNELESLGADLETLAEFLNRFFMLIRDEDHLYKKEQFRQIWPSVTALQKAAWRPPEIVPKKADALGLRSVARYIFDVLDSLYIYLPTKEQNQVEKKIAQWRKDPAVPDDHPIHIDPSIERILTIAKLRKKR